MATLPKIVYNFNENSATTIRDYSENGNNGASSSITIQDSARVGKEAIFNTTNENISMGNITDLNGVSAFSIHLAFKGDGATIGDYLVFSKNGVITVTWDADSGTMTSTITDITATTSTVTATIDSGTYYDVDIVFSSLTQRIYVDGVQIDSDNSLTDVLAANSSTMYLGYDESTNSAIFFLNEFKLYDVAISTDNIDAFIAEQNGIYTDSRIDGEFAVGDIISANIELTPLYAIVSYVGTGTDYRFLPLSDNIRNGLIFRRIGHLWDTDRQWALKIDDTPQICFYDGVSLSSEAFTDAKKSYCIGKDGVNTTTSNLKIIDKLSDLPTAVAGVITLETPYNYFFTKEIDLLGDRLDCNGVVSLLGGTPELSKVTSTGLEEGTALLTSEYTVALNSISINHTTALALDATANANQVLDWFGVNFEDSTTAVGTIKNYDNTIFNTIGFLNSGGLTFDGTIGTVAFSDTLFENATGLTSIIIPATLTITRRFRVINSSFVTLDGETALNVSTSATIPDEGYILSNINFGGGGTYLTGVQSTDNKARFEGCRGISNSGNIGQYYMQGNATATTITVAGTFYKAAGTTSTGTYVEKFDVTTTSNKAVYGGSLVGFYKVTVVASMLSANNKVLAVRIAKNGTTTTSSQTKSTSNGSSRSESIMSQDVVQLSNTDYIEVFVANTTDTTNITVEDLNVIIERIN